MAVLHCNDDDEVMKLLENSVLDVNLANENGNSVLHLAIQCNSTNVSRKLISLCDINSVNNDNENAFYLCAKYGRKEIGELLMEKANCNLTAQDKAGNSALHIAFCKGNIDFAKMLIERNRVQSITETLNDWANIKIENGWVAFHYIAWAGNLDLLPEITDISTKCHDGKSALHLSLMRGHNEFSKKMIDQGLCLDDRDDEGNTPLHCAIAPDSHATDYESLLDGILPPVQLNKFKLHFAAARGKVQVVDDVLGSIDTPNAINEVISGVGTPLDVAMHFHQPKMMQHLTLKGCRMACPGPTLCRLFHDLTQEKKPFIESIQAMHWDSVANDIGYAQEINHCEYITAYENQENFSATAHYDSLKNWNKDLLTVPFEKLVQVPTSTYFGPFLDQNVKCPHALSFQHF